MAFDIKRLREHFDQTSSTDLKYMSYSSEAVLKQSPITSQVLMWVIATFILIMIIWASFATVDEFTRGEGKIVPSSDIQIVQNLEGGILAKLMVTEGDIVAKGQPLLQIDDTIFASTFKERALQANQLAVKAARLRAEAGNGDFQSELEKLGNPVEQALVDREKELFSSRRRQYTSELESLKQKANQKNQELSSIKVKQKSVADSYNLLSQELTFTEPLVAEGAIYQIELLRLQRQ